MAVAKAAKRGRVDGLANGIRAIDGKDLSLMIHQRAVFIVPFFALKHF